MKHFHRMIYLVICSILLLVCMMEHSPTAYADSDMTASEECIAFIKDVEGFSLRPYYDYRQHTVGYGTKCPTEKYFDYLADGIPMEEADLLLRDTVTSISAAINQRLIRKYNLVFTQNQFDALVSFSFNLGTGWMTYDSSLREALSANAADDELVYAFGLYCTAGGNYSTGLILRRLAEANMFLNGVYSKKPDSRYGYVFYEPNGGSLTYQVQGFICDNNVPPAADALRSGDTFLGWYTDLTGGTRIYELSRDLAGKTLFARWESSQNTDPNDSASILLRVTGDVVNIRKGPGTNYGIAKQVLQNDTVVMSHVTELSGRKWGKVENGWICLDYTNYQDILNGTDIPQPEDNPTTSEEPALPPPTEEDSQKKEDTQTSQQNPVQGVVSVNDLLRIRSGPGITYTTVGYLVNGHRVEILEQKTVDSMVWGRISRGWISMNYIVTDAPENDGESPTEPDPNESESVEGKVIADALRIRTGPATTNPIAGFYYQNDRIVISEVLQSDSGRWGKTDKGWVNMDYVLTDSENREPSAGSDLGKKTVIADCLRVRKQIGTDSRIAALLYYGDPVTVLETRTVDDVLWGRVDKGWICMDYVE